MAGSRQQTVGEAGGEIGLSAGLAAAVAALQPLDVGALQRRWRALVGGALLKELGRPLLLRILAYKLQAERLGDLDRTSLRELAAALESGANSKLVGRDPLVGSGDPVSAGKTGIGSPGRPRSARPGTTLIREHDGVLHRVMVLNDGVAWNGKTYDSLSQVAFAITGTRWNGPRFFGLRDKPGQAISDPSRKPSAGGRRASDGNRPTKELPS